jgi:hypothetical protein
MLLGNALGMEMNDVGAEKFGAEVTFPPIGSHVVYAQLYGFEGEVWNTVCFGCIFPMAFTYNTTEMYDAVKRYFVDLSLRKLIKSPTGYYWYETDTGDTVTGFIWTDPTGATTKPVWEEKRLADGTFKRVTFDPTGLIEFSTFSQKPDGHFSMKNTVASLKHICDELQDILSKVSDGTNWLGNLGAPLVYVRTPVDAPRLVALQTEIGSLLE